MPMNQGINIDLRSSGDSQASLPRELRGRRRGSLRLRKHRLGDFHQLFGSRQDQGDISCYCLGDVVVLHSGWRAQGLEPGAMVTVKSVLPSGVGVYFESRQEDGRNAVLSPQDLSTWDLTVHRQPPLVHRVHASTSAVAMRAVAGRQASSTSAACSLVEDW